MNEVLDTGYYVVPNLDVQFDLVKFLSEQREYENIDVNSTEFVLGGFGALGNPSSFHHPSVRNLRQQIYAHLLPYFQETFPGRNLEVLFDRFCIRIPGKALTKESWHRDSGPIQSGDILFGGWFNLDTDRDQYFSCVPFTQNDEVDAKGFMLESKKNNYDLRKICVTVPPRSLILFNQKLIHEIKKVTIKDTRSYRLYMGWRITDHITPMFPTNDYAILNQSIPLIPSGQTPVIFAQMHYIHKEMIYKFSQHILPALRDNQGRCQRIITQGLIELDLAFEEYSEEETALYRPQPLGLKTTVKNNKNMEILETTAEFKVPEKKPSKKRKIKAEKL